MQNQEHNEKKARFLKVMPLFLHWATARERRISDSESCPRRSPREKFIFLRLQG